MHASDTMLPGASPFHAGERALQARAGVAERMEQVGRVIVRDHMPEQHRELFTKLPFMIVGSLDGRHRPWASIVAGRPGFVAAPDERRLAFTTQPAAADPLRANLALGAHVGLLGIEPHTRRRNRMNGVVSALDAAGFEVSVSQSFGNCPKYIQAREPHWVDEPASMAGPRPVVEEGALLSDEAVRTIRAADTFFIASASPNAGRDGPGEGVDVSHRGGKPGFVRVAQDGDATLLTVPDFIGNFLFNTLGNLLVHPAAGLLFIDFERGSLMWLQAEGEVVWEGEEVLAYAGAQRLLKLRVTGGRRVAGVLPLRFGPVQQAAQLAATGTWPQEA